MPEQVGGESRGGGDEKCRVLDVVMKIARILFRLKGGRLMRDYLAINYDHFSFSFTNVRKFLQHFFHELVYLLSSHLYY